MINIEKFKLSNFDEKKVKTFLRKNNKSAVIISPDVNTDGETEPFIGSAELYSCDGKELILWTLGLDCYHHIHFENLNKFDSMYMCRNKTEAKKIYLEWCKLPSTIDKRKTMIENEISKYEKSISKLKEKLEKID